MRSRMGTTPLKVAAVVALVLEENRLRTFGDRLPSSIRELTRASLRPPRWSTSRVERILSWVVSTHQQFVSVNTGVE